MPDMDERTPMKLDLPVILTARQVCEMCQISMATLTIWENTLGFPVRRMGDGPKAVRRYPLADIELWFKSRCSVQSEAVA